MAAMSIVIRSTKNCPNTPRILFGLEELGLAYTMERVEDGVLSAEWGSPGPTITDGDVLTIEPGAILRHLARRESKLWPTSLADQAEADRLFELQGRRISGAIDKGDLEKASRLMSLVDARLATRIWLLGETFSMVDVYYSVFALPAARPRFPFLASMPNVIAFLDRIAARPAFVRALEVAAANLT